MYDKLRWRRTFMTNVLNEQVSRALSISHLLFTSTKKTKVKKQRPQILSYQNTLKFWVSCDRPMAISGTDLYITG